MKRVAFLAPHRSFAAAWDGWFDAGVEKGMRASGVPVTRFHVLRQVALLGKALRKIKAVRNVRTLSGTAYFVTLPHISEYKLFPATYFAEIIPYCYDCWPYRWGEWEGFFARHDIRVAFFSSQRARDHFAARTAMTCHWAPEACNADRYRPEKPLAARSVDVLQYGRAYGKFHEQLAEPLRAKGYVYSAPSQGELTSEQLISRIGDSRLAVCFPRSTTDPEFTGGLETVTLRYFEIMASRTLPIGHCPAELRELFGYSPVIEADLQDPSEQVSQILRNISDYQDVVDRNYRSLQELGTWEARVARMVACLKDRGYTP